MPLTRWLSCLLQSLCFSAQGGGDALRCTGAATALPAATALATSRATQIRLFTAVKVPAPGYSSASSRRRVATAAPARAISSSSSAFFLWPPT